MVIVWADDRDEAVAVQARHPAIMQRSRKDGCLVALAVGERLEMRKHEMEAKNGKSMSRKSMRVATIFTGVATCTAGLAQVANAQDVANPVGRNTSKHIGRTFRLASKNGSIRYYNSCAARGVDHTWLHASTNFLLGASRGGSPNYTYVTSVCFGFKGSYYSPPGIGINAECGGNNRGVVFGYKPQFWSFFFGPGTTYHALNKSSLYGVEIDGWTGTDQCPIAPHFGSGLG